MKFQRTLISTAVALSAMAVSTLSMAGAFSLTTQSLSSRSMATAGAAVQTNDASVAYTNPAAMSKVKAPSASVGLAYVSVSSDISDVSSSSQNLVTGTNTVVAGTNDGNMTPSSEIPSAYYVTPLDLQYLKGYSAGIGLYVPFGFHANYEDTFQGRLFGDHSKFSVRTVAPAIAYEVNPKVSVGASVTLNQAKGYLSAATSPTGGSLSIKGDDTAPGFTLGTLVTPVDSFSLGLVYRSEVKYILSGKDDAVKSTAQLNSTTAVNTSSYGSLRITTPESLELSLGFKPIDNINLYASYVRTNWSSVQELKVNTGFSYASIASQLATQLSAAAIPSTATTLAGKLSNVPAEQIKYEDSDTFAFGGDVAVTPKLTLRGGIAVDRTPTTDATRSVRLPTTDRMLYALGANFKVTPKTSIDIGYSYVKEDTAKISQAKLLSQTSATAYNASFSNSANIAMLQLNHTF